MEGQRHFFVFQARAMIALVTPQARGGIMGNEGITVLGIKKTRWVESRPSIKPNWRQQALQERTLSI
jgi:hypothetical protein